MKVQLTKCKGKDCPIFSCLRRDDKAENNLIGKAYSNNCEHAIVSTKYKRKALRK